MLKIKKIIIIIISVILILFLLKFLYCEIKIYLNKNNFYVDTYKKAKNYYDNNFFYDNNLLYVITFHDLYFYNLKTKKIIKVIKNIYQKLNYKSDKLVKISEIKNNRLYILNNIKKSLDIFDLKKLKFIKSINIKQNKNNSYLRFLLIVKNNKFHIYDRNNKIIYIYNDKDFYIKSYHYCLKNPIKIKDKLKYLYPPIGKISYDNNNIYILTSPYAYLCNPKVLYYINKYDLNGNLLKIRKYNNNISWFNLRKIELEVPFEYSGEKSEKEILKNLYLINNKKNMLYKIPKFMKVNSKTGILYLFYSNYIIKYNFKTQSLKIIFRFFSDYLCSKTNATKYLYKHLKNDKKTLFFWYSQLGYLYNPKNIHTPPEIGKCIFLKDSMIVSVILDRFDNGKQIFYQMDYDGNNRKLIKLNLPTQKILKDNNQKILKERIDNYLVYLKYKFLNFFYKLR